MVDMLGRRAGNGVTLCGVSVAGFSCVSHFHVSQNPLKPFKMNAPNLEAISRPTTQPVDPNYKEALLFGQCTCVWWVYFYQTDKNSQSFNKLKLVRKQKTITFPVSRDFQTPPSTTDSNIGHFWRVLTYAKFLTLKCSFSKSRRSLAYYHLMSPSARSKLLAVQSTRSKRLNWAL